mgnify:CR=1 FL=1
MDLIALLQLSPFCLISMVSILGLLVGSFLNVVIYRLPIMMESDWKAQCDELNNQTSEITTAFTLSVPRSRYFQALSLGTLVLIGLA